MIIAGIVTYNPDISRLDCNIDAILPQVDEVVIFDNSSINFLEIVEKYGRVCSILENHNRCNVGVAYALNEICRYALNKGAEWVLTLDQDSVCPDNIIDVFSNYKSNDAIGILSPRIFDRNIGDIDNQSLEELTEVDSCITSASFLNLNVWREIGGFWDELFIDMVDFDICWNIKERGYKIVRVNSISLTHELGHSKLVTFRGNKVAVLNHLPKRYYYIFRNTIVVGRKHKRRWQCFRWNVKRLILVLKYENQRFLKICFICRGIFDGIIGRMAII